jgi:hypothetical protein
LLADRGTGLAHDRGNSLGVIQDHPRPADPLLAAGTPVHHDEIVVLVIQQVFPKLQPRNRFAHESLEKREVLFPLLVGLFH